MIKFTRLKKQFNVAQMRAEVKSLETGVWKPHYNYKHYEGNWTTLQLRSINGDIENPISIHGSSLHNMMYEDTPLLKKCCYLQSVINFFQCEKMGVRLMNLHAGATIKEHTDYNMNVENGEARFHIPVKTNTGVAFKMNGQRVPMKEGECWYLNLSVMHSVNNFGDTNRIHLVIDCKVNTWIKKLLREGAGLTEEIHEKTNNDTFRDADKLKIIHELRKINTTTSNSLADEMERNKL
jgi:hypothetical protein